MIVIKRRKKEKRKTKSFSTKNWYCISVSIPKIGIVSLFQYQILVLYRFSVPNFGIETLKPSFAVFLPISEVTYNYIN